MTRALVSLVCVQFYPRLFHKHTVNQRSNAPIGIARSPRALHPITGKLEPGRIRYRDTFNSHQIAHPHLAASQKLHARRGRTRRTGSNRHERNPDFQSVHGLRVRLDRLRLSSFWGCSASQPLASRATVRLPWSGPPEWCNRAEQAASERAPQQRRSERAACGRPSMIRR